MELKVNNAEIWVTASFGVAGADGKASVKDLTKAACKALQQAKEACGNCVVTELPADCAPSGHL
jgi:GGDEF domain-containing protein